MCANQRVRNASFFGLIQNYQRNFHSWIHCIKASHWCFVLSPLTLIYDRDVPILEIKALIFVITSNLIINGTNMPETKTFSSIVRGIPAALLAFYPFISN